MPSYKDRARRAAKRAKRERPMKSILSQSEAHSAALFLAHKGMKHKFVIAPHAREERLAGLRPDSLSAPQSARTR